MLLAKHSRKAVRSQPALPWQQIHEFWQHLTQKDDISSRALQLTILTALRTSEVLNASWHEFDFETKIWTIPAQRMKCRTEHRVPLNNYILEILDRIPKADSGLLFEGRKKGQPAGDSLMMMKIRRMNKERLENDLEPWQDRQGNIITVHGFRSTFRDWVAENTIFDNIVAEQALAHAIGDAVEAAYRRGDLLERRRELMEDWGSYATKLNP